MTVANDSPVACVCERPKWAYGGRSVFGHEACERPMRLVCGGCGASVVTRCGRSSRAKCAPCGETYRRRVRRVFLSGWSDNPRYRLWLLTVTAPGQRVHRRPDGSVCACTPPGGVSVAGWNYRSGERFNRFMQDLRRRYGNVQYARAAEIQGRGAIHFHILFRSCGYRGLSAQEAALASGDPDAPIRLLAMKHGFGHEVDLQMVEGDWAAGYCAKYVSKSCDSREGVPWMALDPDSGELIEVRGHGRFRTWTSSRRWGSTMAEVKRAQAAWVLGEPTGSQPEHGAPWGGAQAGAGGTLGPPQAGPLDLRTGSYTTDEGPPARVTPTEPGRGQLHWGGGGTAVPALAGALAASPSWLSSASGSLPGGRGDA